MLGDAGKSRITALVAVYLAAFRDYGAVLAAGERGVVLFRGVGRHLKFVPSEVETWLEQQGGGSGDLETAAK